MTTDIGRLHMHVDLAHNSTSLPCYTPSIALQLT